MCCFTMLATPDSCGTATVGKSIWKLTPNKIYHFFMQTDYLANTYLAADTLKTASSHKGLRRVIHIP